MKQLKLVSACEARNTCTYNPTNTNSAASFQTAGVMAIICTSLFSCHHSSIAICIRLKKIKKKQIQKVWYFLILVAWLEETDLHLTCIVLCKSAHSLILRIFVIKADTCIIYAQVFHEKRFGFLDFFAAEYEWIF